MENNLKTNSRGGGVECEESEYFNRKEKSGKVGEGFFFPSFSNHENCSINICVYSKSKIKTK